MIRGTGSEDRRFRDAIRTTRPNSRYKKARPRDETRSCVLCGPTGAVTAEYQCDSSCLDGFAHVDHDGDLEHERLLNSWRAHGSGRNCFRFASLGCLCHFLRSLVPPHGRRLEAPQDIPLPDARRGQIPEGGLADNRFSSSSQFWTTGRNARVTANHYPGQRD